MSVVLEKQALVPPGPAHVDIQFRVSAQVNITPFVARQKVNVLMLDQVGNLLHGGEPEFLVSDRFYWRVPVLLSTPKRGLIGQVGAVRVDAQTGEVLTDAEMLDDLAEHARRLLAGSAS
jgi:hypothetical protein